MRVVMGEGAGTVTHRTFSGTNGFRFAPPILRMLIQDLLHPSYDGLLWLPRWCGSTPNSANKTDASIGHIADVTDTSDVLAILA